MLRIIHPGEIRFNTEAGAPELGAHVLCGQALSDAPGNANTVDDLVRVLICRGCKRPVAEWSPSEIDEAPFNGLRQRLGPA